MKSVELDYVRDRVDNEGFHYAFTHYSDFEEIGDDEFHRLRKAYIEATSNLALYLNMPDEAR